MKSNIDSLFLAFTTLYLLNVHLVVFNRISLQFGAEQVVCCTFFRVFFFFFPTKILNNGGPLSSWLLYKHINMVTIIDTCGYHCSVEQCDQELGWNSQPAVKHWILLRCHLQEHLCPPWSLQQQMSDHVDRRPTLCSLPSFVSHSHASYQMTDTSCSVPCPNTISKLGREYRF